MNFAKFFITVSVAIAAASAYADTFDYSFSVNGTLITGSFEGVAAGNLLTNLSHVSARVNGLAILGSGSLSPIGQSRYGLAPGVASFDGKENNFMFISPEGSPHGLTAGIEYVGSLTDVNIVAQPASYAHTGLLDASEIASSPTGWSVTAVPEPETYALMLAGLGLIGAVTRRRKKIALSA